MVMNAQFNVFKNIYNIPERDTQCRLPVKHYSKYWSHECQKLHLYILYHIISL